MTWAKQFNQEKQNQINWWSAENISNAADWENFTPVGQSNYDIKINDNLLNEDNFIKYWSKKKINNFAKGEDIDKDGIPDLVAIDDMNKVRGFNNKVTYPKSESLFAYKQNYYKQSKKEREKNPFSIYLESQANIPNYKELDKYKSSRNTSIWKKIYNWLLLDADKIAGYKLSQVEAYSKKVASLIPYIFFDENVSEDHIKVIMKDPEFKQMVKDEINKSNINKFLPSDLNPGLSVVILKNHYRSNDKYKKYRCNAQTAAKIVEGIKLRKQSTNLRKQAKDQGRDKNFITAFEEFMRKYYEENKMQEE